MDIVKNYIYTVFLVLACTIAGYNYGKAEQLQAYVKLATATPMEALELINPEIEIAKNTRK